MISGNPVKTIFDTKIFNHIDSVYSTETDEIKLKSRISMVILMIFDLLYTLFTINLIIQFRFDYLFFTFLLAEIILILLTIGLLHGRYRLASNIIGPTFFITISVALNTTGIETFNYIYESAALWSHFFNCITAS